MPIAMKAGAIVTSRRTAIGICLRMKPCMTTWPASVPTAELERPEPMRATAKIAADALPSSGSSVLCALSIEPMSVRPLSKNVLAAITSIAMLIRPAIVIATMTSIRV